VGDGVELSCPENFPLDFTTGLCADGSEPLLPIDFPQVAPSESPQLPGGELAPDDATTTNSGAPSSPVAST